MMISFETWKDSAIEQWKAIYLHALRRILKTGDLLGMPDHRREGLEWKFRDVEDDAHLPDWISGHFSYRRSDGTSDLSMELCIKTVPIGDVPGPLREDGKVKYTINTSVSFPTFTMDAAEALRYGEFISAVGKFASELRIEAIEMGLDQDPLDPAKVKIKHDRYEAARAVKKLSPKAKELFDRLADKQHLDVEFCPTLSGPEKRLLPGLKKAALIEYNPVPKAKMSEAKKSTMSQPLKIKLTPLGKAWATI